MTMKWIVRSGAKEARSQVSGRFGFWILDFGFSSFAGRVAPQSKIQNPKSKIALLCLVVLSLLGRVAPATAAVDAEQVRRAIERGVDYLKREQQPNGTWKDHVGFPGGSTALCTLALLTAGVPADDAQVQASLAYLRKLQPERTYVLALQTMVLALAEPEKDLLIISRNARLLESTQIRQGPFNGAWDYGRGIGAGGDNSNSQFALLGLHEAERVGVTINEQVWRRAYAYWRRTQQVDGSWGYKPDITGTGSMTCAGVAAMIITSDKLNLGDARVDGDEVLCCGQQEPNDAVDRGLAWLARVFSVRANPGVGASRLWLLYYLYGVERVGRLTNHRLIGLHDWYREGAEMLVASQEELSGFWPGEGVGEQDPHVSTSFALLFLAKGKRPVLAAKVRYEPLTGWNRHRSDLSNLTAHIERRWKHELTWQVLDLEAASVEDMLHAPVLYISGDAVPVLSDQAARNLREYVDRGGFLFAEACCESTAFDRGFRELMERVFPEPEYGLTPLPPEHPIWAADARVPTEYLRPLFGIDVGCRTSVVYCPADLGCYWELARPGREVDVPAPVAKEVSAVLTIGTNVMAYATGREIKDKLEFFALEPGQSAQDPFERAKLYIAKIQHAGGWNAAPGALVNLMQAVSREAGVRVSTDQRVINLADPAIFGFHMVFMHGRNSFRLSDDERKQLRLFVERGGLVFADSVCASDDFAAAFRREMAATFADHPMKRIPPDHAMFTDAFGGFDLKTVTRRDPQQRDPAEPLRALSRQVQPELEGVEIDGRYGVIFSPFDLSCALERHESLECAGYTREDAARIGLNVVLYSLHQ